MSVLKPSPVKDILSNLIHPLNKLYLGLITLLRCHSNCPRISFVVGQVGVEPTYPKDLIYSQVRLSDSAAGPKIRGGLAWTQTKDLPRIRRSF